jgi:hypothetical protein
LTECQNFRIYFINREELSILNPTRTPEAQPHNRTKTQNELEELPVSDPADLTSEDEEQLP